MLFDSRGNPLGCFIPDTLEGFILSNNATTPNTDIDVSPGVASSQIGAGAFHFVLGGPITKRLQSSGSWSAGSGGNALDTGAIAVSTFYHIFLIQNLLTGATDIIATTSATTPRIPAGYTGLRRIGAIRTDSSGNILPFLQFGDEFRFKTVILDVNVATLGTTRVLFPLTVPTGLRVSAVFTVGQSSGTVGNIVGLCCPDDTDETAGNNPTIRATVVSSFIYVGPVVLPTDTLAQIAARAGNASTTLNIVTRGWIDPRGRIR